MTDTDDKIIIPGNSSTITATAAAPDYEVATDPVTIALIRSAQGHRSRYRNAARDARKHRSFFDQEASVLVEAADAHRAVTNAIRERDDRPNLVGPDFDEWDLEGADRNELHLNDVSAVATLKGLGYVHVGGVQWKPPLGGGLLAFGAALKRLKAGARIARAGWNGKGQFAYLVPAASYPVQTGAAAAHFGEGSVVPYRAYLALKTVDDTVSTWAPSVSDVLAEDWLVLP